MLHFKCQTCRDFLINKQGWIKTYDCEHYRRAGVNRSWLPLSEGRQVTRATLQNRERRRVNAHACCWGVPCPQASCSRNFGCAGQWELLVLLPLSGSSWLAEIYLFFNIVQKSSVILHFRIGGSPCKAAGISDTASTTLMSLPAVLRFTEITSGFNYSIVWGQEKEASVSHDVAVQAVNRTVWKQVGVDSMFPELDLALTHTRLVWTKRQLHSSAVEVSNASRMFWLYFSSLWTFLLLHVLDLYMLEVLLLLCQRSLHCGEG